VLHAEELSGDKGDVVRVCKKVMNEASKKRMISKQECMVLLADLDLVLCTETVENISISASKRLRKGEEENGGSGTFIEQYTRRPKMYESMSMTGYYEMVKNPDGQTKEKIPNFVGINGTPVYPVTESYARHVLIVSRPWRSYPRNVPWKEEFDCFINSNACPLQVRMNYTRVMQRYHNKMSYYEPKATEADHSKNAISGEDTVLMTLCGLAGSTDRDYDTNLLKSLHRGEGYEWDREPKVSKMQNPVKTNTM
jgi:hypothetical protein